MLFSSLVAASLLLASSVRADCNLDGFQTDYGGSNCGQDGGDMYYVAYSPTNCGCRLSSIDHLGRGTYTAKILAAGGPGVNTNMYLYSYGRNNDQSQPWNEIDFEILGPQYGRVWSNFWTGFGVQHGYYLNVPGGDTTGTYNNYTFHLHDYTIDWWINNQLLRSEDISGYSDMVSQFDNNGLQLLMSLWCQLNDDWADMGNAYDNTYPLYAHYQEVHIYPENGEHRVIKFGKKPEGLEEED